jgi:hypothetical protein
MNAEMLNRLTLNAAAAALLAAGMLTGCGSHVAATTGAVPTSALTAQSKTAVHKGAKASADRKAPPKVAAKAGLVRQGFAASQASQACDNALQQYQNLTYQWNNAWSDYDKDQIETQMLQVLHDGLNATQSITSAQGVDAADRRSYDIADQGLNRYDSSYSQWSATWDVNQKRYIVNNMLTDMVNTLQQIRANY